MGKQTNWLLGIAINLVLFYAVIILFCSVDYRVGFGYALILALFFGIFQQIERHLRPPEVAPVVDAEPDMVIKKEIL